MSPYSIPLCTILTKWPAPSGPTWVTQGPESVLAAIPSSTGCRRFQASLVPPGISDGPRRAPSSPPETPIPTKLTPPFFRSSSRRRVSTKWVLPPSMTMSPASSSGFSWFSTSSTGLPALIIIMIRRGFSRAETNSASDFVAVKRLLALSATNFSVTGCSRFHTATEKPWSSMLRARFRPITARPIIPKSDLALIFFVLLLLPGRVGRQQAHELVDQVLLVVARVRLGEEAIDALAHEALPGLLLGAWVDGEEQGAHVAGRLEVPGGIAHHQHLFGRILPLGRQGEVLGLRA